MELGCTEEYEGESLEALKTLIQKHKDLSVQFEDKSKKTKLLEEMYWATWNNVGCNEAVEDHFAREILKLSSENMSLRSQVTELDASLSAQFSCSEAAVGDLRALQIGIAKALSCSTETSDCLDKISELCKEKRSLQLQVTELDATAKSVESKFLDLCMELDCTEEYEGESLDVLKTLIQKQKDISAQLSCSEATIGDLRRLQLGIGEALGCSTETGECLDKIKELCLENRTLQLQVTELDLTVKSRESKFLDMCMELNCMEEYEGESLQVLKALIQRQKDLLAQLSCSEATIGDMHGLQIGISEALGCSTVAVECLDKIKELCQENRSLQLQMELTESLYWDMCARQGCSEALQNYGDEQIQLLGLENANLKNKMELTESLYWDMCARQGCSETLQNYEEQIQLLSLENADLKIKVTELGASAKSLESKFLDLCMELDCTEEYEGESLEVLKTLIQKQKDLATQLC